MVKTRNITPEFAQTMFNSERVQQYIQRADDGCWNWTGPLGQRGYAVMRLDGPKYRVHRIAVVAQLGRDIPGLDVDHLCRNHSCVNPAHLEAVSHRTNVLRGESVVANQARRTHCPQGHPLEWPNLVVSEAKRGNRKCKTCNVETARRHRRKKSA